MIRELIGRLTKPALNALFPIPCLGCGREGRSICESCVAGLPRLTSPRFCVTCAQPGVVGRCGWCRATPVAVDGIRAPFVYAADGVIQKAIYDFKFHGVRVMASELAGHLADCMASYHMAGDVIFPVPSHPRRLRSRGFNQAALLARELGRLTGIPVEEGLLVRTKDAPSQLRMSGRPERWGNVVDSFEYRGDAGVVSALLVDDIVTTGATMSACAEALKDAGATEVWGLAVARAP